MSRFPSLLRVLVLLPLCGCGTVSMPFSSLMTGEPDELASAPTPPAAPNAAPTTPDPVTTASVASMPSMQAPASTGNAAAYSAPGVGQPAALAARPVAALLTPSDLGAMSLAYDQAMRAGPHEPTIAWDNTATGRRGRLTPFSFSRGTLDRPCQMVTIEVEIDGDYRVFMGDACRVGGRWQVQPSSAG